MLAVASPHTHQKTKTSRKPSSSTEDSTTNWAKAVVAGLIVAGPHVRNAARRHLEDLKHGHERGLVWDVEAAERVFRFCASVLKLSQGKFDAVPFDPHPAQRFILGSIFGWKKLNGKRRFRRAYIEIAKGAGKSPMGAAIGLYCLVADGEAQGQVYSAASQKAQARVVFDFAVRMWQQSPDLTKALHPTGQTVIHNLAHMKSGSYFRPVSIDEGKFSGPMPSCVICDELHEHKNGDVIEMMERGFKSRDQPLIVMITNSGSDRQSVCWQEHQHAVNVAAGTMTPDAQATYVGEVLDDSQFSFVCGLDLEDDLLQDESCWVKANPLIGITFPYDEMRRAVAQAKAIPGKLNNILRLHGCVWTESDTAWMSRPTLEACLADFDPMDHSGEKVHVGLDLSATKDLTAMAFVVQTGTVEMPNEEGRIVKKPTFDAWVEAWTPEKTLSERALRDQAPYESWVKNGFLNAVPGEMVRFDFVAARFAEMASIFQIEHLAYDNYGFKRFFEPELDLLGQAPNIVEHPQGGKKKGAELGLWMPGSKLALEELMLQRRIRLLRSPVLVSAIMSAVTEEDPFGNSWFSKRKATNRIDALVALAMAIGAATSGEVKTESIYEKRGLLVL